MDHDPNKEKSPDQQATTNTNPQSNNTDPSDTSHNNNDEKNSKKLDVNPEDSPSSPRRKKAAIETPPLRLLRHVFGLHPSPNAESELTELLLSEHVDPNMDLGGGFTALHKCAISGNHQFIRILVDAGADVEKANSWKRPPLYYAIYWGHLNAVKKLLDYGARGIYQEGEPEPLGETPLHLAARNSRGDIVQFFLERGEDPEKTNFSSIRPNALVSDIPTDKIFQSHFAFRKIKTILAGHLKDPECPFYKDTFPKDIIIEIFDWTWHRKSPSVRSTLPPAEEFLVKTFAPSQLCSNPLADTIKPATRFKLHGENETTVHDNETKDSKENVNKNENETKDSKENESKNENETKDSKENENKNENETKDSKESVQTDNMKTENDDQSRQ